jgi:anti-anti-sigma factor
MAIPQGIVRASRQGPTVTFQVEGWARLPQCVPLRHWVQRQLDEGTTRLAMDLRRCAHMDSTFVGTLLLLRRLLQGRGQFVLLAPSPACVRLFHEMGLDEMFAVESGPEIAAEGWTELHEEAEIPELRDNMVEAHRELAKLDGAAGEPFRAMVESLDKELQGQKPR